MRGTDMAIAALGLGALFMALHKTAVAAPEGTSGGRLTVEQVKALAQSEGARHGVDPLMLRAIAEIESSRNPAALRYESHISDYSAGLMQVLTSTAAWLSTDMGYSAYGRLTRDQAGSLLIRPEVGMYFGAAYCRYLSRFGGQARSEQWIVRGYNGGPGGATSAATAGYWTKYQAAKARLA